MSIQLDVSKSAQQRLRGELPPGEYTLTAQMKLGETPDAIHVAFGGVAVDSDGAQLPLKRLEVIPKGENIPLKEATKASFAMDRIENFVRAAGWLGLVDEDAVAFIKGKKVRVVATERVTERATFIDYTFSALEV